MEFQFDRHILERAKERGTDIEEIKDVIQTGFDIQAKYGRKGKAKIFEFNNLRHGKFYVHKRVEVIFIIEGDRIIVVTVYVFYGRWELKNESTL